MRLRQNNRRQRVCVGAVIALLSLGAAGDSSAQMLIATVPEAAKPKIEGIATWYKVPTNSRTKSRAGKDELTAANNKLPLGTKVRVTHLGNGKNVVVRITDRGIYRRGVVIDLCKEAAEKLDIVHDGSARVRLEVVPDDKKKSPAW